MKKGTIVMTKKIISVLLSFIFIITLIPTSVFAEDVQEQDSQNTSPSATSENVTIDEILKAAAEIIRQNESRGRYDVVNPDDNGALSIGWVQWHANRALNLLKTIVEADTAAALEILGSTLYDEITSATSWSTRILTADEKPKIERLISTDAGKAAQDALAAMDISSYVNRAIGYGITDPAALVYYADIENQCGMGGAKRVAQAAAALAGSYEAITLEHIHKAALADASAGDYAVRRNTTYNFCYFLEWGIGKTEFEVWDILSARNARQTPDTASTLVSTIPKDTKVIISEKAYFDGLTRGKTGMGWITISDGSCALNESLTGGYVGAPISFDTDGGSFGITSLAPVSATVTKYNAGRSANDLSVFDSEYSYGYALTNAYGYECTVDASGVIVSAPKYGACKSEIPEGGMVISAHGTMGTWLYSKVKEGNIVVFEKETMTLYVFENENALLVNRAKSVMNKELGLLPTPKKSGYMFAGWIDSQGNDVNFSTICSSLFCITLKAKWKETEGGKIVYDTNGGNIDGTASISVDGINTYRTADLLILYRNKASTETNPYGNEAIINADGYITEITGYGKGNAIIPTGGFVLSGHGVKDRWITTNLSTGMFVAFDEENSTVWAYKTKELYDTLTAPVSVGSAINSLPEASREYHRFLGWFTPSGEKITEDTIMPAGGLIAIAKWEVLPGSLSFDTADGELVGKLSEHAIGGTNIHRAANTLVVYRDRTSTSTNAYGMEVLIGPDGIVDIVFPYGIGNNTIQTGSTVISGHGTASTWLKNYVSVGSYVHIGSDTIEVWPDKDTYIESKNIKTSVLYGEEYGALPKAYREGHLFLGWKDNAGNTVSSDSNVFVYGDVTLTAIWEKMCAVTFDPEEGTLISSIASATAAGYNMQRYANTLVIYAGKPSTQTNAYGTEAVISPDGTVTAINRYGNSTVPDGGYVISGHGTMSSWILSNLSVGNYVRIEGFSVKAYDSAAAYDAQDGTVYVKSGDTLKAFPKAEKSDGFLAAWMNDGMVYSTSSVITSDITLSPKWTRNSAALIFDTRGGRIEEVQAMTALSGINIQRASGLLVLYDNSYAYPVAQTNPYGSETAIDADGYVISKPTYGACKTAIPQGGYVLSGHGNMSSWLVNNVDAGDYIYIDKDTMLIKVYNSYADYLAENKITIYCNKPYGILPAPVREGYIFAGWQDYEGNLINEKTIVTNCESPILTAVWKKEVTLSFQTDGGTLVSKEIALDGTNIHRAANTLVLYKDKASTSTNPYGAEAIIDAEGKIIEIKRNIGNSTIPEGGFVLSGHGTKNTWIANNLKVGAYVELVGTTVKVYDNRASFELRNGSIKLLEGDCVNLLPIPKKYGYDFEGWFSDGQMLTESTVISESCTYTAKWTAKEIHVTFDTAGGSFGPLATVTADGKNVHRAADTLIIYDKDRGATTSTNIYGVEAIINHDGVVTEIRPFGNGNAPIPENGYVISGHDAGSAWINSNLKVGYTVVIDELNISVYEDADNSLGTNGKTVIFGTSFGKLPTPKKDGYIFEGWTTSDGVKVTEKTVLSKENSPLVLIAKWKKA